jgi:MYG1 exonuclease
MQYVSPRSLTALSLSPSISLTVSLLTHSPNPSSSPPPLLPSSPPPLPDIIRSRDPAVLNELDILVDVGGKYDPEANLFDHHQRGFDETFSPDHTIKLSSAGLIYKHFGLEIIRKLAPNLCSSDSDILYRRTYDNFIKPLDAIDNGINQYAPVPSSDSKTATVTTSVMKPRYRITTDLASRVGHLNPSWNENASDDDRLQCFHQAISIVGSEFKSCVDACVKSWFPAREIVFDAVSKRFDYHPSGQVVVFKDAYTSWKAHIYDAEKELKCEKELLYVIFADSSGGTWRIQCVSKSASSFENRKSLPSDWCGIRNEQLSEISGIDDCVFCHANGFIGGNKTFQGAIAMANQALLQE